MRHRAWPPVPWRGGGWRRLQGRGSPSQAFLRIHFLSPRDSSPTRPPHPPPPAIAPAAGPVIQCLALRAIHLPPASQWRGSPGGTRWSVKKSSTYGKVKLLGGCRVSAVGIAAPKRPSWYLEKGFCVTTPQRLFASLLESVGRHTPTSHFRLLPPYPPLLFHRFCIQLNIWSSTAG